MAEDKNPNHARHAAMLGQDATFLLWLDRRTAAKHQLEIPDGTHTEQDARDFILKVAGIESRRELNTNPAAAQQFLKIVHYFKKWKRGTGVA